TDDGAAIREREDRCPGHAIGETASSSASSRAATRAAAPIMALRLIAPLQIDQGAEAPWADYFTIIVTRRCHRPLPDEPTAREPRIDRFTHSPNDRPLTRPSADRSKESAGALLAMT